MHTAKNLLLTASDVSSLHRAGCGMYRPKGAAVIAKCDALVSQGLLARNPDTGIYFLTEAGSYALVTS